MRILAALLLALPLWVTAQDTDLEAESGTEPPEKETVEKPQVILHTSMGAIELELDPEKAPKSVENFLQYARDGHYDGTIFHRVIENFMIQGGGFDADFNQKSAREPVTNEADNGLSNERGTVAMARTNDPHSATAQFFINTVDNTFLDHRGTQSGRTWGYAVFGRVTSGMKVVDMIRVAETGQRGPHGDVPVEPIVIERVELKDER